MKKNTEIKPTSGIILNEEESYNGFTTYETSRFRALRSQKILDDNDFLDYTVEGN